jgi:hypothetical protein
MPWTADYDDASGIVLVGYHGATVGADIRAATSAAITLSKTHGSRRFLVDTSEASISMAPIEIFNLSFKQYPAEHLDRRARIALLLPPTAKERELAVFYETVCRNRDWLVQRFETRDEACRWLNEDAV